MSGLLRVISPSFNGGRCTIFDEEQASSDVNIEDMIIIGDFNDGVEDNDFKIKDSTMWNGYQIEEGFY